MYLTDWVLHFNNTMTTFLNIISSQKKKKKKKILYIYIYIYINKRKQDDMANNKYFDNDRLAMYQPWNLLIIYDLKKMELLLIDKLRKKMENQHLEFLKLEFNSKSSFKNLSSKVLRHLTWIKIPHGIHMELESLKPEF